MTGEREAGVLREALAKYGMHLWRTDKDGVWEWGCAALGTGDVPFDESRCDCGLTETLARLAAIPASDNEGLDAAKLARAIDAAWRREGSDHHAFGPGLADEGRVLARLIAAEWPDA